MERKEREAGLVRGGGRWRRGPGTVCVYVWDIAYRVNLYILITF